MCPQFKSGPRHLREFPLPGSPLKQNDLAEHSTQQPGSNLSGPDPAGDGGSSNGRTTVFGTVNRGSNPCPPASSGVGHPRPVLNAVGMRHCSKPTKYGAYSSKAERLIVDQKVTGSSPVRRP